MLRGQPIRRICVAILAIVPLLTLVTVAPMATTPAGAAEPTCLNVGSESQGFGSVTDADWDTWTGINLDFASNEQHLEVASIDGAHVLRQQLVPTSQGSPRVTVKGDLAGARTYSMSQRVYFEPGFDWGRDRQGGKLGFGLGGGTSPTGGDIDPDGFSARFMWRGNGDGTARIALYSYAADRTQNLPFGDDYDLEGFSAPIGQWFTLTMEITANSANGHSDGSVRAWADGELALDRTGIMWQDGGAQPTVDRFIYATFYGGNGWEWAPAETEHVRFTDVCWQAITSDPEPSATPPIEPPAEPLIDGHRQQVDTIRSNIAALLPTGSGQVDWRLNNAAEQLADADAGWLDSNQLTPDSETLRLVQRAISKLNSAASSSGASDAVRLQADTAANQLAAISEDLAEAVVADARSQVDSEGCECRSARRQLSRADDELLDMRQATTAEDQADHARRAWSRAQLAIAEL